MRSFKGFKDEEKRYLLFFLFYSIVANAECTITAKRIDFVSSAFKQYGGWKIAEDDFSKVCKKLKNANAGIVITGVATVLGERSVAWVNVVVFDKSTGIISQDFGASMTSITDYGSQNVAEEEMIRNLNKVVSGWDTLDSALNRLDEVKKNVEKFYSKNKK